MACLIGCSAPARLEVPLASKRLYLLPGLFSTLAPSFALSLQELQLQELMQEMQQRLESGGSVSRQVSPQAAACT